MKAYNRTLKTLFLATVSAGLMTACGDDEEKEAFLAKAEGTWKVGSKTGCVVKEGSSDGLLTEYTIKIENAEEEKYTYDFTETFYIGDNTCKDAGKVALTVTGSGAFDLGDAVEGLEDTFKVVETPVKFELKLSKDTYVSAANKDGNWVDGGWFCGFTDDWTIGTAREVTGKTCKIGTGFSQEYLPAAAAYDIMKIKDGVLTRGKAVGTTEENRPTELADATVNPEKVYYKETTEAAAAE